MQNENNLLTAEISIEESDIIETRLAEVNAHLERYTNQADRFDYALSVASGVLCGMIDSLYVGEFSVTSKDKGAANESVNRFITKYAKSRKIDVENLRLDKQVEELEEKFKVAQDNVWKGKGIGVAAKDHHLADLAHHPTPIGLVSAIIVQFLRVGTFVNRNGEWHFVFIKTDVSELVKIWTPVIITGVLNWLLAIAEAEYEEEYDKEIPEAVHKLAKALAVSPVAIEVVKCADNWFGHLVSDMAGSKQTAGDGMGIPGVFMSLLYEVGSLPIIKETGLLEYLDGLYLGKKGVGKHNLRTELPYAKEIGKQALPVLINEVIVRTFYFIRHLIHELQNPHGNQSVEWSKIVPYDNRTIDRMLAVSSMTFSIADTADAAVRAAIESGGNAAIFAGKFVTRYNYIGAGRATIAVVKEFKNESEEARLWHEKRLLLEQRSSQIVEQIDAYEEQLEALVTQYIAEDIELYLTSFNEMDQALAEGDSDRFIQANVKIQSRFGREVQFETQEEFDELMDSDDAFVL